LAAAAYSSALFLKPDGTLWSWGANGYGQLGDGTTTTRLQPVNVSTLADVRYVSGGHGNTSTFALAVTGAGALYAWGNNSAGQLGDGTTTAHATPTVVPNLSGVIQAKAGEYYATALKSDGTVWNWGSNGFGQLGNGGYASTTTPVQANITGVVAISSWSAFTLALKSDGTVWGWGTDYSGELGDGTINTNRPSPVQTANLTGVVAIANGWIHGLAVKSNGTVWAWGRNTNGQLGDGTFSNRSVPVQVSGLTSVTAVAGGENHSLALKSDGTVWAWGDNSRGELGDGTTTTRTTPVQVSGLSNIVAISAGTNASLAVTTDGIVYAWGANNVGQVGDWTTTDRWIPVAISDVGYVWKAGAPILSVAAGTYNTTQSITVTNPQSGVDMHYTLSGAEPTESDPAVSGAVDVALSATLKVAAWATGFARSNTTSAAYILKPVAPVFSPLPGTYTTAQSVSMSTTTSGATIRYTTDGTTPTESSTAYTTPVSLGTTTTLNAVAFKPDWSPSATASGTYTMNFGTTPTPTISPEPGTYTSAATITLTGVGGATIRYTTDGSDPTSASPAYAGPFVLTSTSTLKARAWLPDYAASPVASAAFTIQVAAPTLTPSSGAVTAGQIITVSTSTPGATITYTVNGVDPVQTDALVPSSGALIAGNYTYKARAWKTGAAPSPVASGTYSTSTTSLPMITGGPLQGMAARTDGTVWSWGDNAYGALGDGTNVARPNPVPIALSGVRTISAGWSHGLALLANGTVKSWGVNVSGEVGDGTNIQRWVPTTLTSLSNILAIDCGYSFGLAVRADGAVFTWGYNGQGQLGNGTQNNGYAPGQVSGLTSVMAVAGGLDHSLALRTDGTVWAWGDNASGQLGDGTTARRTTPVQVVGLTGVTAIDAGFGTSVALKSDGTVWTWGANGSGQLGDGTLTNRLTPVQMSGITNAVAVTTRYHFTMVLKADHTVWTVGENGEGQLGTPGPNRSLAMQVPGLPDITFLGAGDLDGYLLTADGSAWAWGRNSSSNIGDGTTITRGTPVQIAGPGLVWRPWIPTITQPSGQYTGAQNVLVTNGDSSAVMHATTTGIDPTESDPVVASGAGVSISDPATLKVRSFKTSAPASEIASASYTLKVVAPAMSPTSGAYASAQTVAITTTTTSSTIRYTTDGSTPTGSSAAYAGPLSVVQSTTVKAYATRTGWVSSDIVAATYSVTQAPLPAPTISPSAGSYGMPRVVTIATSEPEATIRYTTDGSDPTSLSPSYVRGFAVGETMTIKARVFKAGHTPGDVASATFTFAQSGVSATPSVSPVGGRFVTRQTVTVTGAAGATLRYTTNGSDPTTSDATVVSGSTITVDRSMVLKVRAWQSGLAPSVVHREDYLITGMIAAGEAHNIALKADGTVWTWGDDWWAQIGDGGSAARTTPYQALTGAVSVAAGFHHCLVLKADGTVWAWGQNLNGEVGDGTTTMRRSPVQVPGLTNVVALAASFYNSYAVKADGTVWAWGANAHGQIGDGTTTTRLSPVQVPALSGVRAVAAGEAFAVALVTNGASLGPLWSWGYNNVGQLGNGSTSDVLMPQPVAAPSPIKTVAAGRAFMMARTIDDELLLWGTNDNGQLANGVQNGPPNLRPVRTGPWMAPVAEVGAGHSHALALGRDGRLWGWGHSCESELLTGTSCVNRLTADEIPAFATASAVSGGAAHTIVEDRNGQVWAWGYNGQGQLGDGTLTARTAPVQVTGLSLVANSFLASDPDGDGLSTWREYQLGTDPLSGDSDGDGIPDGADTLSGESENDLDPDHDGLATAVEVLLGTDPYNTDSDGDGVSDGVDAFPHDPTRTTAPPPDPNDHTPPVITLTYPSNARPVGGGL
jgi:alpha-tubulin suppressor-like RCC1 family protein